MKRKVSIVVMVVVVASLVGCSVRRVPTTDPRSTAPQGGAVYDPQGEAASPPPPAVAASPASSAAPPSLEVPEPVDLDAPAVAVQDLAPPAAVSAPTATEPAPSGAPGFRVQVFAGRDRAVAEQVRQEVEARIGSRAYIAHEDPYHKVRVGDCPTKDACRELLERLRAAGYDAVWVVPDQIAR